MQFLAVICVISVCTIGLTRGDGVEDFNAATMPGPVLFGGREKVNPDSEIMQTLTSYVNDRHYNATNLNESIWIVSKIKNVTQQLVAGMIYRFDAVLSKTKCLKAEVDKEMNKKPEAEFSKKQDLCVVGSKEISPDSEQKEVHYEILSKPWMDLLQVMSESSPKSIEDSEKSTTTTTKETTTNEASEQN